jgi:hypothetical protein
MIQDGIENPYRKYILPLAYEHLAPLYAILGLAACHQGVQEGDSEMRDNEAVHYQSLAIRSLLQLLEKETSTNLSLPEYDALLATIQILVLHDICESGVSTHGAHVTGSSGIGARLLAQGKIVPVNDRTVFFVGNLAWLDVLRAFSGPERMCFSWDLLQAVAEASSSHFERVNGIPRGMVLIMGSLLWDAKHHEAGELAEDQYVHKLNGALDSLKEFDVNEERQYPDNELGWDSIAESFRHACILRVLRLLDPFRPPHDDEIQLHVMTVLEATAEIPNESRLIELLIMPIFIAGTDTIEKHSRRYVINVIDTIWARSGMANSTPKNILLKLWDERDNQDEGDDTYVSWTKYVRTSNKSTHRGQYTDCSKDPFCRPRETARLLYYLTEARHMTLPVINAYGM